MLTNFTDSITACFGKPGNGFLKCAKLGVQIVFEHRFLEGIERIPHTISKILMEVFILRVDTC